MGAGQFSIYTAFKAKDGMSPVFKSMTRGANSFETRLDKLNNSAKGVGASLKRTLIGGFVGFLSFATFKTLGEGIIRVTAKFEQFRISLQTLLKSKDEGNKFFNSLVKFASISPLEVKDVVPAARQLLAYGLEQNKIIDKLGRLSDLSMGDSEKFSQLVYAYGKTKTVGIASMRELRMFSTAGVPIFDAISKYKNISKKALLDAVKHRKITYADIDTALTRLTNKDGMFYQMTIKQSQTLQGLWSTSKDNLDMMADRIGNSNSHLKIMKGILKYFNSNSDDITTGILKITDAIDKILVASKPIFKELGKSFSYLGKHLIPELVALAPGLKFLFEGVFVPGLVLAIKAMNKLFFWIDKTYNFIKNNWIPIVSILAGIGGMLALKSAFDAVTGAIAWYNTAVMISGTNGIVAMQGFQRIKFILGGFTGAIWKSVTALWAQTTALLMNPWTWAAVGIALVVAGIILLWKNWDKVTEVVGNWWNNTKNWLSAFWTKVQTIFGAVGSFIKNNFVDILLTALGPIGWIIRGFQKISGSVSDIDAKYGGTSSTTTNVPIYKNNPSIQNSNTNSRLDVGVSINNTTGFGATSSLNLIGPHSLNLVPGQ